MADQKVRAAVIGCGKRGRLHAAGLSSVEGVELVACADPFAEAREEFVAAATGCEPYEDAKAMLAAVQPDVVAICTRPALRLEPVRWCIEAGVRAVQCEKPMAMSWDDAVAMHRAAEEAGMLLTFTHQRRFRAQFAKARRLLSEGVIGQVVQIQGRCSNFFDWGTHWLDIFFFMIGDDVKATSVMAQADLATGRNIFDAPVEGRGVIVVAYDNGQRGVLVTEAAKGGVCDVRIIGEGGMIEIRPDTQENLRVLTEAGGRWEDAGADPAEGASGHSAAVAASLASMVDCLRHGGTPLHSSEKALKATEIIYAAYASRQVRGPVDLPLPANPALNLAEVFAEAPFSGAAAK